MENSKFRFRLSSTKEHCPFAFTISLDGHVIDTVDTFDQNYLCEFDIADQDAPHTLEVTMTGKTAEHTKIDQSGEILDDILVYVTDAQFDEIEVGYAFLKHSTYIHDFNGTQDPVTEKFLGVMGCNGSVKFDFRTPAYLWLLENLE